MTTGSTGAVFFLGTRAHYQVLQQPESRYDVENGNASTETIYQSPSVQLWKGQDDNWRCDENLTEEKDRQEIGSGVKRRTKRRSSETALCERDNEMRPALLNNLGQSDTQKSKPARRRINLLAFLTGLARRKRRLDSDQIQYLQHLESALTSCTYRESCRCLECQSRYFECDESEEDYSSEEEYAPRFVPQVVNAPQPLDDEVDDDDEVFVDTVPGDNTSTDMLIDGRETREVTMMSVSSDDCTETDGNDALDLEVAAGTPVLLNYLLTHPITCNIQ